MPPTWASGERAVVFNPFGEATICREGEQPWFMHVEGVKVLTILELWGGGSFDSVANLKRGRAAESVLGSFFPRSAANWRRRVMIVKGGPPLSDCVLGLERPRAAALVSVTSPEPARRARV